MEGSLIGGGGWGGGGAKYEYRVCKILGHAPLKSSHVTLGVQLLSVMKNGSRQTCTAIAS